MEDLHYVQTPLELDGIQQGTSELQFSMASEPLVGAFLRVFGRVEAGWPVSGAWHRHGNCDSVDSAGYGLQVRAGECRYRRVSPAGGRRRSRSGSEADTRYRGRAGIPEPTARAELRLRLRGRHAGKDEGLEAALAVVKPGGFYIIDDMLPQPNWPEGHAAKVPVLIEQLAANPDFEIVPMVWASGVVVAVRK